MQTPMAISGEQPKISVWLDNNRSTELKRFHCTVCGKVVFEYYNDTKIILPGEMTPSQGKSPIVIQCHGAIQVYKNGYPITTHCKAKYWIE